MTIGIMSAMPEEAHRLAAELRREAEHVHGGRVYYTGELDGVRVVLVFSRIGKVAAAATAQHLIDIHRVGAIVFTGVAGAIDPTLRLGDIVVADRLWQHDMDASPIFPALEIPLLGRSSFEADRSIQATLVRSAEEFVRAGLCSELPVQVVRELGLSTPRVVVGDVASGDRFVSSQVERRRVRQRIPGAVCVEMEGGAVAQVCHEQGVPLGVVRVISDSADEAAASDFGRFVSDAASRYGLGIVRRFVRAWGGG